MRATDSVASLQLPPCFRQCVFGYLMGSEAVTADRHSALIQAATFSLASINIWKFLLLLLKEGITELWNINFLHFMLCLKYCLQNHSPSGLSGGKGVSLCPWSLRQRWPLLSIPSGELQAGGALVCPLVAGSWLQGAGYSFTPSLFPTGNLGDRPLAARPRGTERRWLLCHQGLLPPALLHGGEAVTKLSAGTAWHRDASSSLTMSHVPSARVHHPPARSLPAVFVGLSSRADLPTLRSTYILMAWNQTRALNRCLYICLRYTAIKPNLNSDIVFQVSTVLFCDINHCLWGRKIFLYQNFLHLTLPGFSTAWRSREKKSVMKKFASPVTWFWTHSKKKKVKFSK